jgi:hypothetical protein
MCLPGLLERRDGMDRGAQLTCRNGVEIVEDQQDVQVAQVLDDDHFGGSIALFERVEDVRQGVGQQVRSAE